MDEEDDVLSVAQNDVDMFKVKLETLAEACKRNANNDSKVADAHTDGDAIAVVQRTVVDQLRKPTDAIIAGRIAKTDPPEAESAATAATRTAEVVASSKRVSSTMTNSELNVFHNSQLHQQHPSDEAGQAVRDVTDCVEHARGANDVGANERHAAGNRVVELEEAISAVKSEHVLFRERAESRLEILKLAFEQEEKEDATQVIDTFAKSTLSPEGSIHRLVSIPCADPYFSVSSVCEFIEIHCYQAYGVFVQTPIAP